MNRRKIVTVGIAGVAAAGLSLGVAMQAHAAPAKSLKPAPATQVEEPTAPDTDAVQQGDQAAPDTVTAVVRTVSKAVTKAVPAESTSETAPEEAANPTESAGDGPGGHADPAGDVQHEGGASEQ